VRRKVMVICVDGGKAPMMAQGAYEASGGKAVFSIDPVALTSVYPSSTAPAHASFLTGVAPGSHGILGNRYFAAEPAAQIRSLCKDPLHSIHPYERRSLLHSSLIDRLQGCGRSVAGVHFPHTFDRIGRPDSILSSNCLYAPSRVVLPSWQPGPGILAATVATEYFSRPTTFALRYQTENGRVSLTESGKRTQLQAGEVSAVRFTSGGQELWVPVQVVTGPDRPPALVLGTAAMVMRQRPGSGVSSPGEAWSLASATDSHVACSAGPSYELAGGAPFHESPSIGWVLREAQDFLSARPDMLLVRFNQVDHAQEALYWHAERAQGDDAVLAREEIRQAYVSICTAILQLMDLAGSEYDVVLFSDHGIDWVDRQLSPNAVLAELDLSGELVFQGDSNIAYLYGERTPSRQISEVTKALRSRDSSVRWLNLADLTSMGVSPAALTRAGLGALTCGLHRKFDYDGTEVSTTVRSASHGYWPAAASMNGFFAARTDRSARQAVPRSICEVAAWIAGLIGVTGQ
jgi:type I phosphodiesterase/nucleotide pyrophosphatase